MARIKYNVKGVDSGGGPRVKPGMYQAKIKEIEEAESQSGNGAMLVVQFEILKQSDGSKTEFKGQTIKSWVLLEHEPSAFRLRQFLEAVGKVAGKKGESGAFDPEDLVGLVLQISVKSDKDSDGEYMPRVGKVLSLESASGEDEEEDDDGEEDEEEDSEDEEGDGEEEDEEPIDLDDLDRDELKQLIKDEELGIRVLKKDDDAALREKIAEAMGVEEDDDGEEEDDDEEEDEDDGPDLDSLDRAELKSLIKERELEVKVLKKDSDDDLREKVRAALGDATPDYSGWDSAKLKAELKERGIELDGRFSAAKARKALEADDKNDQDPF